MNNLRLHTLVVGVKQPKIFQTRPNNVKYHAIFTANAELPAFTDTLINT